MFFSDWKEKGTGTEISKSLLWEYDMSRFDFDAMKVQVVQRVIERGWPKDFYAAITRYGGLEPFKGIIKEIPVLSAKNISFVCTVFDLKKEELKCYTRKQLREERLSF